ncbi:glycine cleavage system aminomethyltransferase GcvT [Mesorhizobium australicum]|uniref:aminomethyltransferase n=1 Tax=Mesorhizobium australicum TaxID=536018 RepID=A0A1X7MQF5_9HYPH|nr:glycine cleavage system aminomethyltransferase GcvT [Mesorhizobium australicum]SMH26357.1 aminomethyltransferase [Mesorhizobium australicum]
MKKTPFYDSGLEYGAKMVELFGYYLPWEYGAGHTKEHLGTREGVSVCDLDYMAEFVIEGPDALGFIQMLATNDFSKKTVGSVQYTAMCDENGLMIDDCTIWCMAQNKYMIISGSEDDYEWVSKQAKSYNVTVTNVTDEHTTLAVQGPMANRVLQQLTDIDLSTLGYYRFRPAKISGIECLVARMGYTGEAGFELHFASKDGATIWNLVMNAGKQHNIVPCAQAALESLRQEAGYLLVGKDHDRKTNPFEAGIGFTVKFSKEDFIGKAALQKIAREGVKRRMVWLDIPSGDVAETGDKIFVGDVEVGAVTSGSFSPTRKRGTAMAYINPRHAVPSLDVQIALANGKKASAKLSVMPLYDPGDTRTKSFA